jgi:plasmid stability protein
MAGQTLAEARHTARCSPLGVAVCAAVHAAIRNPVRDTVGLGLTVDGGLRGRLAVRLDVEVDEEEEVARKQPTAEERRAFRARAAAEGREVVLEHGRFLSVVRVGCTVMSGRLRKLKEAVLTAEVYSEQVDDELRDLNGSNILLPLHARLAYSSKCLCTFNLPRSYGRRR